MWWLLFAFLALIVIRVCTKVSYGWCYSRNIMTGKVIIVTGANTGIGYETAMNLAKRGAKVIMACRDDDRGSTAADNIRSKTGNNFVTFKRLDLASFKSIRQFVADIKASEVKVDVLINNAGIAGFHDVKSEDGLIVDLQVNHFGPFLLTHLLLPLLKEAESARVVNVASVAHYFGELNFDTINNERAGILGPWRTYSTSKLCNILFSNELAYKLEGTNITSNSLHPGHINTSIYRHIKHPIFVTCVHYILSTMFKHPMEGAQTLIYLAVSDDVEGETGGYYVDCKRGCASAKANNEKLARQLWEYSEKAAQLAPDEKLDTFNF